MCVDGWVKMKIQCDEAETGAELGNTLKTKSFTKLYSPNIKCVYTHVVEVKFSITMGKSRAEALAKH